MLPFMREHTITCLQRSIVLLELLIVIPSVKIDVNICKRKGSFCVANWLILILSDQAVPNYIFVSRKRDLEKPIRQPGKKKRGHEKKRTRLYVN